MSPERTYDIPGRPVNIAPHVPLSLDGRGCLIIIEAFHRATVQGLRPTGPDEVGEAEFARASGRGLRRVRDIVRDAKGMGKKE